MLRRERIPVDRLTPKNERSMREYEAYWIDNAKYAGVTYRAAAEDSLLRLYELAGMPAPKRIAWFESPAQGAYAAGYLDTNLRKFGEAQDRYMEAVTYITDNLLTRAMDRVTRRVIGPRFDVISQTVERATTDAARSFGFDFHLHRVAPEMVNLAEFATGDETVGRRIAKNAELIIARMVFPRATRRGIAAGNGSTFGGWDSYTMVGPTSISDVMVADWLSLELGIDYGENSNRWLKAFVDFMRWGSYAWCDPRFAILSDRPIYQAFDVGDRLHNETGPAISWADGSSIYAWHGQVVPSWVIEEDPFCWDVDSLARHRNITLRSILIERYGWDNYVVNSGAKLIDRCPDPANDPFELQLYQIDFTLLTGMRVLVCTNASVERDGTRRRFGLPVPIDTKTALDAAAWTFGISAEQYRQLNRAS